MKRPKRCKFPRWRCIELSGVGVRHRRIQGLLIQNPKFGAEFLAQNLGVQSAEKCPFNDKVQYTDRRVIGSKITKQSIKFGQALFIHISGKIANEDFWSPPRPSPPLSDRFCKKSEKIRINSEWPNSLRNRKKKNLPLGGPPKKTLKNFQNFFSKILVCNKTGMKKKTEEFGRCFSGPYLDIITYKKEKK